LLAVSETRIALNIAIPRIWRELRCLWCEMLIAWALKISPDDYVPACMEAAVYDTIEGFIDQAMAARKAETP
jgi:hypothetical protein